MSRTITRGGGNSAPVEIGIYSETDRLRTAALYGGPGTASLLAQRLPTDISLFLTHMDVLAARREMDAFASVLESHGVEVIKIRELLAQQLPESPLDREETVISFMHKASKFDRLYNVKNSASLKVLEDELNFILDKDAESFGEKAALALAYWATLKLQIPAANMLYARDQTNVALDRRIVSSMAYEIRKPEPEMFEMVYRELIPREPIRVPAGETFEGGDLYVHDNTVFIGIGARTTANAAIHIFKQLGRRKDTRYMMVHFDAAGLPIEELQKTMHLDTYSIPIAEKQTVVCDIEASKRKVIEVRVNDGGGAELFPTGKSFPEYLKSEGHEILSVTVEEQQAYACNLLNIDEKIVVLPTNQNPHLSASLFSVGKEVKESNMANVLAGYGGAHCVTSSLLRA